MINCPQDLHVEFDTLHNCSFMSFEGVLNRQKFIEGREYVFAQIEFHNQINRFIDLSKCEFDLGSGQLDKLSKTIRDQENQDIAVSARYKAVVLINDALGHGIIRSLHSLIGKEEIELLIIKNSDPIALNKSLNFLDLPLDYNLPSFIAISENLKIN